jgi:predicted RNA-binding protein
MCELRVHVNTPTKVEDVAQDVVYAQVQANHVLLKDVLGATRTIPDTFISTVDIGKEALLLRQSPVVAPFLRFLDACETAETTRDYSRVEESWNDFKAEGDKTVRSLWRKYGRSQ